MLGNQVPLLDPVSAAWNTVGRFDSYASAQRAVDRLSDDGFPVEKLDIVGSGLRTVERVTGRLTRGRATGAGALSGAAPFDFSGRLPSARGGDDATRVE